MPGIQRLDHIGITVADLDLVTAFFVGLGLEIEGRQFVEGEFIDTVLGMPNAKTEIVMVRPPDGGTALELATFIGPGVEPGSPDAPENAIGMRNLGYEVDDLLPIIDRLAAGGYGLVGDVGEYEGIWRMAHVRGPEGIIVSLSERIG